MTSPLHEIPDRWTVRAAIGKLLRELRQLRRLERLAADVDRERCDHSESRVTTDGAAYQVDAKEQSDA